MPSARLSSSTTVPFTPKPERRRTSRLTREIHQAAETLASVRRVRADKILEELDNSGTVDSPPAAGPIAESSRHGSRVSSLHQLDPVISLPQEDHRSKYRPSSSRSRDERTSSKDYEPRIRDHRVSSKEDEKRSRPVNHDGLSGHREERVIHGRHKVTLQHHRQETEDGPERVIDLRMELDAGELEAEERLLDNASLEIQEAWLCEDLLYTLQGVEGSLIRYDESYDPMDEDQRLRGVKWKLDPSISKSLLSLVERLVPLGTYFTSVEAYMELRNTSEYGMASQALGSGIRAMLKEYRVLVAQLESLFLNSSTFTLQTLYFHLHPTIHTMSLLSSLCLALDTEDAKAPGGDSDDDDDDDPLGGMAEELGLAGEGLKGLMKNLKVQDGVGISGGPVLGGEVLGIICEREATMSGDPTAATLHSTLLLHASQPYCRMLLTWVTTGYLSDPFDEFMVRERGHINKGVLESDYTDEYWERRYTLRDGSSLASSSKAASGKSTPSISAGVPPPRPGTSRLPGGACIPSFLQAWKHKILLAGKYLNVIRECGIEVKKPGEVEESADQMVVMTDPVFYKRIEDAYIYANKTLLKLMLDEQELIPHLRSVKHFFFLDQSDYLTNFLDVAASELRKPAKSASLVKLQSLMDLAVRNPSSSSSYDPFKDDLKVTMQSQGLYDWLYKIVSRTGGLSEDGEWDFAMDDREDEGTKRPEKEKTLYAIDGLALDYSVKFPLSLVISRKTLTRYQIIFRFLLHLHHLESALGAMWLEHKSTAWRSHSGNEDLERWKTRIYSLRSRMMAFVRQVLAFATSEVLETNWRMLEDKLAKVETVDQVLKDHVDYLDTCLKQCMLTTPKLLSVYAKLMATMSTFVAYSSSLTSAVTKFVEDPMAESDEGKVKQRWTILERFEINFDHNARHHLDAVTYNAGSENVALLALVTRLHQTTLRI